MNREMLKSMMHSPVRNYALPGLTSWLIGNPSPHGTLRLFSCERDHQEAITPHSHRFDFQCWVLAGRVTNRLWTGSAFSERGDMFLQSNLVYEAMGQYRRERIGVSRYAFADQVYRAGDWYSMTADQIHSIAFAKGAEVMFFEGPTVAEQSVILEPWVDGEPVPTFKVEPWMFKKEAA